MNKTLLIVDDEKHMLRLLEFNLNKVGCSIITSTSGQDALLKATSETIDLLIIDYQMPDFNGLKTISELRNFPKYEKLPIILLTARGQISIRDEAMGLGVSRFFTKPFSPTELLEAVKQLLA